MTTGTNKIFFNKKKVVFLHIQKTGGSSVINMAKKYYHSLCSHGDCWGRPTAEFQEVDFVSGHLGYSYLSDYIDNRYSFTFLRDPVDRIISLYYFCRKRDPGEYEIYHMANTLSFEQFLYAGFQEKLIKDYIWNNQTWQLACGYFNPKGCSHDDFSSNQLLSLAIEHAMTFSRIGITETLAEDQKLIANDLGFPDNTLSQPHNANLDRPHKDNVSSLEREMLYELTHLDIELYNHVSKYRLDKKIKTYNP